MSKSRTTTESYRPLYKLMRREPTPPGTMLWKEFLEPAGISQSEFARHVGWTQCKVNEIIRGKRAITAESALVIADAIGTTPEFWIGLQTDLDLWRAFRKHKVVANIYGDK